MITKIDKPKDWLITNSKGIGYYHKEPRSFKAYQQIVQAKLDIIDLNLKIIERKMLDWPYTTDVYKQLAVDHHQLLECQDEWLNLTYSDYLRLLAANDNKNLGWKNPC